MTNVPASSAEKHSVVGLHLQHTAYLYFRSHADCHQPKNQVLPTKSNFLIHGKIKGVCRKQLAVGTSVSAQLHQEINSEKTHLLHIEAESDNSGHSGPAIPLVPCRKLSCHSVMNSSSSAPLQIKSNTPVSYHLENQAR